MTTHHAGAQVSVVTPKEIAPKISTQPVSVTVEQNQIATFKVAAEIEEKHAPASTYGTISYQWMKDGARVTGATSAILTLTNVQPADAGAYSVVLSNRIGWAGSNAATLTVIVPIPATIITQPSGRTVVEGGTVMFEVSAIGTPAPTYRWRKNGVPIAGATNSRLTLGSLRSEDAGSYDVLVTNSRNSVLSRAAALNVLPPNGPRPEAFAIVRQPASTMVQPGETANLVIDAVGGNLAYQWKKNGIPVKGGTSAILTLNGVTATDMGFYAAVVTSDEGMIESEIAVLAIASPGVSRLINLSTRGYVPAGGSLMPGFTLRGAGTAELLVRAVGPTLARFGVTDACTDPALELIPAGSSSAVLANDDWSTRTDAASVSTATARVGAFGLEAGSKDAALLASLNAATQTSYTARITPKNATAGGIVLAEIYDAAPATAKIRLAAVSTLGYVGAGERTLVAGFTIEGTAAKRLLVRAVGSSLRQFGLSGTLANPELTIATAGNSLVVAHNDDGSADPEASSAAAANGAFALAAGSADAALVITLPPGGYTVTVSGVAGGIGTALVEIYDLDR